MGHPRLTRTGTRYCDYKEAQKHKRKPKPSLEAEAKMKALEKLLQELEATQK
jgi:hypothetical protein